jgi:hypothetical protein
VGIIPLQAVRSHRSKVVPYRFLDSMGGIAVRGDLAPRMARRVRSALLEAVDRVAEETKAVEIRATLSPLAPAFRPPSAPRVNPLLSTGFSDTSTSTWILRIDREERSMWEGMEGRARTAVRKAEQAGITVRRGGAADLDLYYRLHRETYERTGARPHPRVYFAAIFEGSLVSGLNRIWIAERDGEALAAGNFAWYKDAVWYWTGAAGSAGLRDGATSLVQWAAIRAMVQDRVGCYELGEAHLHPSDGKRHRLSEFKRSFGGELAPLFRGRIDRRPVLRQALDLVSLIRHRGGSGV